MNKAVNVGYRREMEAVTSLPGFPSSAADALLMLTETDISHVLTSNWSKLGPDLTGKIHIIVGTADTFDLDGPARLLKTALDSLHARAQVTFLDGGTHMNLYRVGDDPNGLYDQIAAEMYKT